MDYNLITPDPETMKLSQRLEPCDLIFRNDEEGLSVAWEYGRYITLKTLGTEPLSFPIIIGRCRLRTVSL